MADNQFYSVDDLMALNTTYAISIGERSRGKTYSALCWGIKMVVNSEYKDAFCYVRRWDVDLRGKRGKSLFNALETNGEIERLTNGKWKYVHFYAGMWYFCKLDEKGNIIKSETPFCYGFSLNNMEHDKGSSYLDVKFIIFDEFISRMQYLGDEWGAFLNVISTVVRYRNDVRILMLGNTVSMENPYFHELGIYYKAKQMKPGETILFGPSEQGMTIALEFTDNNKHGKPSDIYFDFKSASADMITGGAWEVGRYPRLPSWFKILPKDIVFSYFIIFYDEIIQADIVCKDNSLITYMHRKTTPIKDEDNDLIFSTEQDPRYNWRCDIMRPFDNVGKRIKDMFVSSDIYYQSNEVGEIVMNYLNYFD